MESDGEARQKQKKRERTNAGKRFRRGRTALTVAGVLLIFGIGKSLIIRRHHTVAPGIVAPLLPPATPPGIVLHHSFSPGVINGEHQGLAYLTKIHHEDHPGWAQEYEGKMYYVGYHYIIRSDGVIEQGRPDLCPGAHARTFNNWLGICLIGDFATNTRHQYRPRRPTRAQIKSLLALCESLMAKYHISPQMIKRHRDVNVTYCPGDNFPYKSLMAKLTAYANKHPEMYPTPPVILKIVKPPPLPKKK